MWKVSIVLVISLIVLNSCKPFYFVRVSNSLGKIQKDGKGNVKRYTFNEVRGKVIYYKEASFLKNNFDTLFLLEKFSIESGAYYAKIWNKNDSVSYSYSNSTFSFGDKNYFTKHTQFLISNWDTIGIRYEEKVNSAFFPAYTLWASVIIRKEKRYLLQSIKFREFFNVERDRWE